MCVRNREKEGKRKVEKKGRQTVNAMGDRVDGENVIWEQKRDREGMQGERISKCVVGKHYVHVYDYITQILSKYECNWMALPVWEHTERLALWSLIQD